MAPALQLHRGGRDPVELARLEEEAMRAMSALADATGSDDWMHDVAADMALALKLRVSRKGFAAERAAREAQRRPLPREEA